MATDKSVRLSSRPQAKASEIDAILILDTAGNYKVVGIDELKKLLLGNTK